MVLVEIMNNTTRSPTVTYKYLLYPKASNNFWSWKVTTVP